MSDGKICGNHFDNKKDGFIIKNRGRLKMVCFNDIMIIKADGNYSTCFMLGNEYQISVSSNLSTFLIFLCKNSGIEYLRCHKSYAVNTLKVESFCSKENVIQIAGYKVPVSRRCKVQVYNDLLFKGLFDKMPPLIHEYLTVA